MHGLLITIIFEGLTPGKLVFVEEFEEFGKNKFSKILRQIINGKEPDKINIGGPGIVPLIHWTTVFSFRL